MKVQVQVNEYNIRTGRNEFTITNIITAPNDSESSMPEEPTHVAAESQESQDSPKSCLSGKQSVTPDKAGGVNDLEEDTPLAVMKKELRKRKLEDSDA
ncbi:hypothetical protein LINGRAHAP2_LOCUS25494 [Linum grandiflorum]